MTSSEATAGQDPTRRDPYDQALTRKLQYMEAGRPGEAQPLLADLFLPPTVSDGRHAFRQLAEKMNSARPPEMTRQLESLKKKQEQQENMREAIRSLYSLLETMFDGSTPPSRLVEEQGAIRGLNKNISSLADSYLDECARLEREAKELSAISDVGLLTVRGAADCLVAPTRRESRILLGTSAGGGKTTLLNMIALYFSSAEYKSGLPPYTKSSDLSAGSVLAVRRYLYPLEGTGRPLIPCILRLRDHAGKHDLEEEIFHSISGVLPELSAEEIRSRCADWTPDLILLIDGLDELSAKKKEHFLTILQKYLDAHPATPVILTTRAAGISDPASVWALAAMYFQCRSILPLTDREVQTYAESWIHRMRPERAEALLGNLAIIRSERRYAYLREFTRTPLDLVTFLNLLSEGTVAPSRYRMLRESLWKKFTGHEPDPSRKQHVYTDTINLLGLIAYRMQTEHKLSITLAELDEMRDMLNNLNFYSDLTGNGTLEDYRHFLNLLAANTGVVDEPREGEFGFPIRTCQEFLAAYACCHLKLMPPASVPDPRAAVEAHATDDSWFGVICFLLSDLESSDMRLFRELLTLTFRKRAETLHADLLLPLIDTDLPVSGRDAAMVCERFFQKGFSAWSEGSLLTACMNSGSSGIYLQAMEDAYYETPGDPALPAYGLALMIRETLAGHSPQDFTAYLSYLFFRRDPKSTRLGCFLIHLGLMNPTVKFLTRLKDVTWKPLDHFQVTRQILTVISSEAAGSFNPYAIRILTDLWILGDEPNAPLRFSGDFADASGGFAAFFEAAASGGSALSGSSATSGGTVLSGGSATAGDSALSGGSAEATGSDLSDRMICRLIETISDMGETVSGVYKNLQNRRTDVRFDLIHTAILALGSLPLSDSVPALLRKRREAFFHGKHSAANGKWKSSTPGAGTDVRQKNPVSNGRTDARRAPSSPNAGADARQKYRYDADIQAFIRFWGAHDPEDRIAWAVAGLLFDGDLDHFRNIWKAEFADGAFLNSKDAVLLREKRHYERIRGSVEQLLAC